MWPAIQFLTLYQGSCKVNLPSHSLGLPLHSNQNMIVPARPRCGSQLHLRIWDKLLIIRITIINIIAPRWCKVDYIMENLKVPVDSASQDTVALTFILHCSMLIPCQLSYLLVLTVRLNLEMQRLFCISQSRMKSVGLLWPPQEHVIAICIVIVPILP